MIPWQLHFTGEISLGSILSAVSVALVALKFHRDWVNMITQHKMMWLEYCRRHRIVRIPEVRDE